jgi:hypothetical protein
MFKSYVIELLNFPLTRGEVRRGNMGGWVFVGVVLLFSLWMVFIYNRLVSLRNEVKAAWKQIDVQLKRRHDLIPNLVSVVKGYIGIHLKG